MPGSTSRQALYLSADGGNVREQWIAIWRWSGQAISTIICYFITFLSLVLVHGTKNFYPLVLRSPNPLPSPRTSNWYRFAEQRTSTSPYPLVLRSPNPLPSPRTHSRSFSGPRTHARTLTLARPVSVILGDSITLAPVPGPEPTGSRRQRPLQHTVPRPQITGNSPSPRTFTISLLQRI